MWVESPTDDSMLVVSGYVQPLLPGAKQAEIHKIFSLRNTLIDKECELHTRTAAGKLRLYLIANATVICNVDIDNYTYGDTLFVAMGVGWNSNRNCELLHDIRYLKNRLKLC
jgi:hypothetical protein